MRKAILLLLTSAAFNIQAADYNIVKYGALNDTTQLSTSAIQQAIDDCNRDGGGRVVIPTGSYKIGTIIIKSNVHLHFEHGATLYGSTRLEDYLPMKSDYVSLRTQTSTVQLIYADKVNNVVIDGYGTIDGRGRTFKKLSWNDEGITRPHLLRFIQSHDITIKDITLKNSGCWMQHYLACDRLVIDGIKVFNRNNYNNDALDLDGCHAVTVTNMIADSDDDGITLKSTSPRLCENIKITDCEVSSHCNAIKLGTETNGGFRNINISNINVKPSADQQEKFFGQWIGSSAISLEIVDGGTMENVHVSNINVEGTEAPIFIRLGNRGRGYAYKKNGNDFDALIPIDHVGTINGIHLDNIQIRNAGAMGCSITGLPNHPVENVWLSHINIHHKGGITSADLPTIEKSVQDEKEKDYPESTMWGNLPAKGFFVRHARNIHFNDVTIQTEQPDIRPDFIQVDADYSWGDQGNGTYTNPVLNADFSDPDVIRVGKKYYMVASDFHLMGVDMDGNGIGEPVYSWKKPIPSHSQLKLRTDDDFTKHLGLQWQWNHNPDNKYWSLSEKSGWLTIHAQPADSLKMCRNMLTQKVIGYKSECTTLITSKDDCYAGIFCSGKQFLGAGLSPDGIFFESKGQRTLVREGKFKKLYLRITFDCLQNQHQFSYSTDGKHFSPIAQPFSLQSGYWKGIRTGIFCYGNNGKAQFDFFRQRIEDSK